jgi:hypothetical protein
MAKRYRSHGKEETMTKEVDTFLTKIKKKIATLEFKDNELKNYCRERWDVNWYGMTRWEEEYEKRHAKYRKEIEKLTHYRNQVYNVYLALVEAGLEEGTKAERIYLGLETEDSDHEESDESTD